MLLPVLDDTIVAISSGLPASAVGIVRLSGAEAHAICRRIVTIGDPRPPQSDPNFATCAGTASTQVATSRPRLEACRLQLPGGIDLPAYCIRFSGPASYTGQDMAEIYLPGSPPLLSAACAALVAHGARAAQGGEFTARALRLGKLSLQQAGAVGALLFESDREQLGRAARTLCASGPNSTSQIVSELNDLIAALEAGIDFADEEDIRFISDEQVERQLEGLRGRLEPLAQGSVGQTHRAMPHVLLAGLANAGKSTLFNLLLGSDRAIASAQAGTTTDVLTATLRLGRFEIKLQDSAGVELAHRSNLDVPADRAAEIARAEASLVAWVHDGTKPWTVHEKKAYFSLARHRRMLVFSKGDLWMQADASEHLPPGCSNESVSTVSQLDVSQLRRHLATWAASSVPAADLRLTGAGFQEALASIRNGLGVCRESGGAASTELIALELRAAVDALSPVNADEPITEQILGRIFNQFCVGK